MHFVQAATAMGESDQALRHLPTSDPLGASWGEARAPQRLPAGQQAQLPEGRR